MIRARELQCQIDDLKAIVLDGADPLASIIKHRFVVTLRSNEGAFSGILTESTEKVLTFEDCKTIPSRPAEQVEPIPGRVHVFVERIAYLQEM